jgi:hypothetical protein
MHIIYIRINICPTATLGVLIVCYSHRLLGVHTEIWSSDDTLAEPLGSKYSLVSTRWVRPFGKGSSGCGALCAARMALLLFRTCGSTARCSLRTPPRFCRGAIEVVWMFLCRWWSYTASVLMMHPEAVTDMLILSIFAGACAGQCSCTRGIYKFIARYRKQCLWRVCDVLWRVCDVFVTCLWRVCDVFVTCLWRVLDGV